MHFLMETHRLTKDIFLAKKKKDFFINSREKYFIFYILLDDGNMANVFTYYITVSKIHLL